MSKISNKPLLFKQIKEKIGIKIDITNFKFSEYQEKINLMKEVCKNYKGIGLASVQIGLDEHLFIAKRETKKEFEIFFNTEVISTSNEQIIITEGCLSIPKVFLPVKRFSKITIKYFNGEKEIIEELDENFSIVVQHELSHLEGKTLFDLTTLNRKEKRSILNRY
jgi:peptide deformylase